MKKYFIRNDGEFYKANLHCHSTVSDGKLSPDELKKFYKKHGYSVLAYTDHNILIAHPELRDEEFLPLNSYELSVFTLDKYSGAAGKQYEKPCHLILIAKEENNLDMVCWNRNFLFANAVNYESQAKFKKSEDNYDRVYTPDCINDIINRAHKGGYYVIYAHPTWSGEIYPTYIQYQNLDAMEMMNYSSIQEGNFEFNDRVYDDFLLDGKFMSCVAGDDNHNHYPPETNPKWDSCGTYTMIKAPKLEYREITKALEEGNSYASNGASIYDLYMEDGKVCVSCSDAYMISYVSNALWAQRRNTEEGTSLTYAEFAPHEYDKWFRIKIVGKDGKFAYSNAYRLYF